MYEEAIQTLLEKKARKLTTFLAPNKIIRVVRTSFNGKFENKRIELTVTVGKPNYAEREFVKKEPGFIKGMTYFKYLTPKTVIKSRKKRL